MGNLKNTSNNSRMKSMLSTSIKETSTNIPFKKDLKKTTVNVKLNKTYNTEKVTLKRTLTEKNLNSNNKSKTSLSGSGAKNQKLTLNKSLTQLNTLKNSKLSIDLFPPLVKSMLLIKFLIFLG